MNDARAQKNITDCTQPYYCLSQPDTNRLVYVSPAALALCSQGKTPEKSWQLFAGDDAFARRYNEVSLSLWASVPLQLPDSPTLGPRLLFSSLVHSDGRMLRQDVMVILGGEAGQGLTAAAALVGKYAKTTLPAQPPAPEDPNEVRVNMFGGFHVETSLGRMSAADISSRQSCLLLIYLLCNRGRVAPIYELAEALWPDQLLDNPYNMIKNVAFRLRRHLSAICAKPLIVAYHGTYILDPELNFAVDCDLFDALIRQYYRTANSDPERLAAAIRLYRGSLLPGFDSELWLIARTQYYKSAFRKAVLDYACWLRRQNNFLALYAVLRDALSICPREASLHVAMVHALAQDKGPAAGRQYLQSAAPLLSQTEQRLISRQLEQLAKDAGFTE